MSESLGLLGYLDDWYLYRRQMLALLHTMWRLYFAMVVFVWLVLPWRLGWQGVGVALWMSFWCAWSRFWPWFATRVRDQ